MVRQKYYRHANGSAAPALSTSSLVRRADGTPLCYLTHVQGIADRRRAEEDLLETQSATDAILTIDSAGNIAAWNTGAERLFGFELVEVLGKPLTIVMPERLRRAHTAGLQRVNAGGEPRLVGRNRGAHRPASRRVGVPGRAVAVALVPGRAGLLHRDPA